MQDLCQVTDFDAIISLYTVVVTTVRLGLSAVK